MSVLKPKVDRVTLGSSGPGGGVGVEERLRATPPVTVRRTGGVLALGVVVSLLFHAAVVWAAFDVPLGRLDPESLGRSTPTMRVERAPAYDRVGPDMDSPGEAEAPQLAAEALAQRMLEQTPPPPPPVETAALDLRPVEDTAPPTPEAALAVDVSSYELPADMLAQLSGAAPADLQGPGSDPLGGEGGGEGDGSGGGNRAGSLAGELLAGGGSGSGGGGAGLGRPRRCLGGDAAGSAPRPAAGRPRAG